MKSLLKIVILIIISSPVFSQDSDTISKISLNGYLSEIPSIYWNKDENKWQNLLHNRLNFDWYPTGNINCSVQLRNQFFTGNFINYENQKTGFISENYFLPLTYQKDFENSLFISLSVDRFWIKYTLHKLEVTAGRQRINWGQTFVWSTNDIFNTTNFFEFDYPERPGVDAIRVQYYTSNVSSLDFTSKIDSAGNISGAGLFRFNKWSTDFQFMCGFLQESAQKYNFDSTFKIIEFTTQDLVWGTGFAGSIKDVNLRGEASYFYSLDHKSSPNQFLLSFSSDYTFKNQLNLMVGFFYADKILTQTGMNFTDINTGNRDIKSQTFTHYNFFGQLTYPINPIINTSLSGVLFYDNNIVAYYIGPGFDLSLTNNITLSTLLQVFYFRYENPIAGNFENKHINYAFLRAKWNF